MASRRYYFLLDASQPLSWVDRYLAESSLYQRVSGLVTAFSRGPAAMAPQTDTNRLIRERIREQAALTERLARLDLFAPTKWAVESASAIEAHPDQVPDRMRAFFAAPHANTDQLILCADREGALDALSAARSRSLVEIATLEPAAQTEAVVAMWRNFALYFERLGVSVLGWARYRRAWRRVLGGTDQGPGTSHDLLQSPWNGNFPDGYEVMFRERPEGGPVPAANVAQAVAGLSQPDPSPPWSSAILGRIQAQGYQGVSPTTDSPIMRTLARSAVVSAALESATPTPSWPERARSIIGAAYGRAPDRVYFGSKWEVFEEQHVLGGLPTGQTAGTGRNVLRLSINDQGRLVENLGSASQYERQACIPAQGLPAPRPGFNWTCSAFTLDAQASGFFLAPLLWYAELLQPLLDYLATRDPLEVVYEIAIDVLGKNLWTTIGMGRGEAALSQLAATAPLRASQTADAALQRMRSGMSSGVAVGASIAGAINPIFGAAVGAGGALLDLVATSSQAPAPRVETDFAGRNEPVIERLLLGPARARPWQCSESDAPTPIALTLHGADIERAPMMLPLSVTGILQAASRELHVVGMVPNAAVAINGVPVDVRAGRWTDDSYGWSVPIPVTIPSGMATVTITPPGEASRSYQLPIRPEGVTNVAYAMMTTGPVLRLLRMVPGGLTSINGVSLDNATGRPDDNMTTWVLPLPAELTGPAMTVRVQAPDGTTRGATVPIASAGPTNVDYATLPAIGLAVPPGAPLPVSARGDGDIEKPSRLPLLVGAVLVAVVIAGVVYYVVKTRRRKKNGRRRVVGRRRR